MVAAVATDQRTQGAFKTAVKMLKRLGCELDTICANGDTSELEKKVVGRCAQCLKASLPGLCFFATTKHFRNPSEPCCPK